MSEVVETEEENGEEEETVEEAGTQVDDDVEAVVADDFPVITSLTPRALTEHCLSCFLFRILSWWSSFPYLLASAVLASSIVRSFSLPGLLSRGIAPVEAGDEVECAGEETLDGGEIDLLDDASVDEDRAGEDNDVEEDTVPSP